MAAREKLRVLNWLVKLLPTTRHLSHSGESKHLRKSRTQLLLQPTRCISTRMSCYWTFTSSTQIKAGRSKKHSRRLSCKFLLTESSFGSLVRYGSSDHRISFSCTLQIVDFLYLFWRPPPHSAFEKLSWDCTSSVIIAAKFFWHFRIMFSHLMVIWCLEIENHAISC